MYKYFYLSTFLATLSLNAVFASEINNNTEQVRKAPTAFASAATQVNLDDASSDCIFQTGNDIFLSLSGIGQLFAIEQKTQSEKQEPIINKQGALAGQQWIKNGVPQFKTVIRTQTQTHRVFAAAEQTTASPHLTLAIYKDDNANLTPQTLNTMKVQMNQQHSALQNMGCLFDEGMRVQPKGLVYIVKYFSHPIHNIIFMDDVCPLGNSGLEAENVYYRLNSEKELVDAKGNKFTDCQKDHARSFIAVECDVLTTDGRFLSADQFMHGMEPALDLVCPDAKLSRKKHSEPLVHITLAKISGTKDNKTFRATSRQDLLFPVAPTGFPKLQQLFVTANTSWQKHKMPVLVADNFVFNPVDAAVTDHKVSAFALEAKQRARATTNWDEPYRQQISLIAAPTAYNLGTDEEKPVVMSGFSTAEISHRWTEGNKASLTITNSSTKPMYVQFPNTGAYLNANCLQQSVQVLVNGVLAKELKYTSENILQTINVTIPGNTPQAVIEFRTPNAHSPQALNPKDDGRVLGLSFGQMIVSHKPFAEDK
jgi:hypothetical protein